MKPSRAATCPKSEDVRCVSCSALLGKLEGGALSIRRGDLQATIDGNFHASVVCYRPTCRKLNVLRLNSEKSKPVGPAG